MVDGPKNIAASVKARLLAIAREQRRSFDVLLVRYALERLLYRLSLTPHRDHYILKGGMLVTQWLDHNNRETRDMDFLGFGANGPDALRAIFSEIMSIDAGDGLIFDMDSMTAATIRDDVEYGGVRLRTAAYLERTRIPVTLDIGFGDALIDVNQIIDYPSLLGMERPSIRIYSPAAVMAEKFQAVVALGLANGRMKDFYDLWAIPQVIPIDDGDMAAAIAATFDRRATPIPHDRPVGLSNAMAADADAGRRWRAYIDTLELLDLQFRDVIDEIWTKLEPICTRLRIQK